MIPIKNWTLTPVQPGEYCFSSGLDTTTREYEYCVLYVYILHDSDKLYCDHPLYPYTITPVSALKGYWSLRNE